MPTQLNCFSHGYQSKRRLYTGLPYKKLFREEYHECILVQNNWERTSSIQDIEVFAYKLYEADVSAFVNIKAQKTPVLLLCDEAQRLTLENMYKQYDGNMPFIFGDKKQLSTNSLQAIKTEAPFVADKIMSFKKEIFNEFLTFFGINNVMIEKAERLISDEASSNNEVINLNLQSMFAPRLEACKQFNQKFNINDEEKKITVRVRSDLGNIIKNSLSIVKDYMPEEKELENDSENTEGVENNE